VADSLQLYLSEINRYPVLSPEEEYTLAERYYRERRIEDAHKLVTSNLRYVVRIALQFRHYGCRLVDLIQEGNIGLMLAVKKFNPYKGVRFITYATWWIKSAIQDFIIKTVGLVKRSPRALKKSLFYRNHPTTEEAVIDEFSLNTPLGDEGNTVHQDMLVASDADQEEALAKMETGAIVKKEVSEAMKLLSDRERLVIEKRVMSDRPESLQTIGDRLGVTRERVRQIESSALKKLGKSLSMNPAVAGALSD